MQQRDIPMDDLESKIKTFQSYVILGVLATLSVAPTIIAVR
jgi:hypothetical protein